VPLPPLPPPPAARASKSKRLLQMPGAAHPLCSGSAMGLQNAAARSGGQERPTGPQSWGYCRMAFLPMTQLSACNAQMLGGVGRDIIDKKTKKPSPIRWRHVPH
jgi:hypothetical protein